MVILVAAMLLAAPAGDSFQELSVDQVDQLIQSKQAAIFDNNGQDEWKSAHVPTAKWVKFNDVKASDLPANKDQQLVFYCHNEQ